MSCDIILVSCTYLCCCVAATYDMWHVACDICCSWVLVKACCKGLTGTRAPLTLFVWHMGLAVKFVKARSILTDSFLKLDLGLILSKMQKSCSLPCSGDIMTRRLLMPACAPLAVLGPRRSKKRPRPAESAEGPQAVCAGTPQVFGQPGPAAGNEHAEEEGDTQHQWLAVRFWACVTHDFEQLHPVRAICQAELHILNIVLLMKKRLLLIVHDSSTLSGPQCLISVR